MKKMVLLSVLLLSFLFVGAVSAAPSQDIYVSVNGNDTSNTGANPSSAYATIAKGVSDVNESRATTIHLGAGTFTGDGNTLVEINKAHRSQGGILTIVGDGYNKTFIDGSSGSNMFSIQADSIVKLVNITFINGKNTNGGAINNTGDLTVVDCIFENNYATTNGGAIRSTAGSLNISNSKFNNNSVGTSGSRRGGAIYATSTTTSILNSNFTNNYASYSGAVALNNATITNSYFANNYATTNYGGSISISGSLINNIIINSTVNGDSGQGGAVYLSGGYLSNNTMINCSAAVGDYIYGYVYNANVTFADLTVTTPKATVTATVTDDMGHPFTTDQYTTFNFYANDILLGSARGVVNGTATLTYTKLLDRGSYNLTGDFGDSAHIRNGTLTVNIDDTVFHHYVSNSGSDDTGDGSQSKPYKTILKAISEGFLKGYYVTIHLLEGTYSGTGNTNITITDIGVLSLIGEKYNKTIIDGDNINWIFKFGQYTQIILKNLTFENVISPGAVTANDIFNIDSCIFRNCINALLGSSTMGGTLKNSVFDNAPASVNGGGTENYIKISNCSFSNSPYTALYGYCLNVTDSKFINNSANYGAAIYAQIGLISSNNEFINNTATNTGGAIYFFNSGTGLYSYDDIFNGNRASRGGAIYASYVNMTCINGTFINNSASEYGGAISGYSTTTGRHIITVENNIMTNNTAVINGDEIYLEYSSIPGLKLIFVGNGTVNINKITGTVTATVADDKGNAVSGGYVSFYLNGSYIGRADVINGLATLTYVGFKNGTYTLTGTYSNAVDPVYTQNGVVKVEVTELDSVDYYVSNAGNDTNGDGSKNKPFATIQKAITAGLELSRTITIHLLEGVYFGLGNTNITLPGTMNITIIGEGVNKTVIDGEHTNWIFNVTLGEGLITLKDFQIINSTLVYTSKVIQDSPIMIAANSTVILHNMKISDSHGYYGGAINNNGNLTVYDSNFTNNGQSYYGGAIYNSDTGNLSIYNSSFVNNTAKEGTAIQNSGVLLVKNSSFKDNFRVAGFTGQGMAIYGFGILNIFNSVFTNNERGDVYLMGNIYNSTFYNGTGVRVGTGNHTINNSSFTGITNAITIQGSNINLSVVSCLFENNTYALYSTSSSTTLVNISNCVILDPIQVNSAVNLIADYNWWGNNTKPVIIGPDNLTLDYWLIMTLTSDNKPGLSKNIKASIDHYTDGVINYAFDGYLPVREYLFGVSNGTINPISGNLTNNIVNAVFTASSYGNHTVNATIDNQTLNCTFELFQVDSTTMVNLSNSTGKKGDTLVITVDVKDENGDPIDGGEVEFFIGNTSIGKVKVVDGKAVMEWVVDGASGGYEVNVRYLGSDAYLTSDNYATFLLDSIVPVVKADIKGGSYNTTKKVTLTATDDQDSHPKIYYTLDGTTPTIKSVLYSGPISITKTTILKFIAVDSAGNVSPVQTEVYTIDTAKPSVTSIDPVNGATKVSAGKTIKVTFSEAIKAGSKVWIDLKNSSGKAVPFKYSISGKVLTIDPTSNLAESLYTLCIHTGAVTDLVGNPVAVKSTKFSVGKAPTVSKIDPKNGATKIASSKTIKVTFNENIKKGSNWFELKNSSGKAISFTSSVSGKVLTIDPKSNLAESLYTLCIHTGAVTDLAGNPVALRSTKFSVGTAPKVSKVNPKNGATKVARTKAIKVTFNENIKAGNNYWIELKTSSGKSVKINSKSISGKVLTIKPAKLAANTKYKLIIHTGAVTDKAGNPVAVKTYNFTTGKT